MSTKKQKTEDTQDNAPQDNAPQDNAPQDNAPRGVVRMVRSEPMLPGGPVAADVHPDEVENWTAHGWRTAAEE